MQRRNSGHAVVVKVCFHDSARARNHLKGDMFFTGLSSYRPQSGQRGYANDGNEQFNVPAPIDLTCFPIICILIFLIVILQYVRKNYSHHHDTSDY